MALFTLVAPRQTHSPTLWTSVHQNVLVPTHDLNRPASATAVPRRWILFFSLATMGTFVGWFGPLQILLAKQAELFHADHKELVLGLVAGIGAGVSMVANPLWGALSDRTTSSWGKRIPWVVGGSVAGAIGLVLLGSATGVVTMILGWCLIQLVLNAPMAALSAAIPDQVPEAQRGTAAGYFGVAQTFGVMAGTGLALAGGSIMGGYLACAAFVLVAPIPFVLLRRDVVLDPADRPPLQWGPFLRGFWISPRQHPDFGWAWLTRFLMNLSNGLVLLYLLFYLTDEVQIDEPAAGVFILTVVNALMLLVSVMVSGVWSDRIGKRRIFVVLSGVVMGVATLLLAVWPTWTVAVIAAAVLGIGFGVFTSVDFALLTQVLPTSTDRGKDLGVLNVANALPQVLAPAVAAPIVALAGGYPMLYGVAGALAIGGGVLVWKIKGVA